MTMTTQQGPGQLIGPPAPRIAFYYGDEYLGEVRGHPEESWSAELDLRDQTRFLYPGPEASTRCFKIMNATRRMLYCGSTSIQLRN